MHQQMSVHSTDTQHLHYRHTTLAHKFMKYLSVGHEGPFFLSFFLAFFFSEFISLLQYNV